MHLPLLLGQLTQLSALAGKDESEEDPEDVTHLLMQVHMHANARRHIHVLHRRRPLSG